MIWYDMIWYDMAWHGMVWYAYILVTLCTIATIPILELLRGWYLDRTAAARRESHRWQGRFPLWQWHFQCLQLAFQCDSHPVNMHVFLAHYSISIHHHPYIHTWFQSGIFLQNMQNHAWIFGCMQDVRRCKWKKLDGKMTDLNGEVSIVRLYIDRVKLEIVRSVVTQLSVLLWLEHVRLYNSHIILIYVWDCLGTSEIFGNMHPVTHSWYGWEQSGHLPGPTQAKERVKAELGHWNLENLLEIGGKWKNNLRRKNGPAKKCSSGFAIQNLDSEESGREQICIGSGKKTARSRGQRRLHRMASPRSRRRSRGWEKLGQTCQMSRWKMNTNYEVVIHRWVHMISPMKIEADTKIQERQVCNQHN